MRVVYGRYDDGMTPPASGLFVVFEGIDGAGKSSLVAAVADRLWMTDVRVTTSREPTNGPWGKQLRESAITGRLSVEEELRLLTEDRAEHVRDLIRPALARGETVLLDRYFYSTAAYQGTRGADPDAVLAKMTALFPTPDLVFLIDLPPDLALARIAQGRGEVPNQFEKLESLAAARDVYLKIAARSANFTTVDGTRPADEVADEVFTKLSRRLALKPSAS
jgi:dTMP kinase